MKMKHKTYRCAAVCAVAALMAASLVAAPRRSASGISVSASIDSAIVEMGDLNHLRVKVDMPESASRGARIVDFPKIAAGDDYVTWNGIDIVKIDTVSTIEGGKRVIDYDFTIQAFDPGTVSLPPFAVLGSEGADTAFSNVVTFKVAPVDVDSLETINPMQSIVNPATRWYDYIPDWLIWTLLGLVVASMAVAAYLLLRKHKVEVEIKRAKPVPPYELAMSRLQSLRSRNLPENGHEKEFYTELVDILRDYLQGRFGINAMEMTSTQIVKALRTNAETRMSADTVKSVLSMADFVKFAKVRPVPDDNVRAFSRAQDFVEQTKPAPEPEPEIADGKETTDTNKPSK